MHPLEFRTFLKAVLPGMGYQWRRFERRNIRRRIRQRMEFLRIYDLEKYTHLVSTSESERAALDAMLRLTITRFFRNQKMWDKLGDLIVQAGEGLTSSGVLKVWAAGCAGGEETFSLAMLLDDSTRSGRFKPPWSILGTDTDFSSLERTKEAAYQWGSVREVPGHLLDRWFQEKRGLWTLDQEIRDSVEFMEHDLVSSEPPGRFHIVLLRNSVLTYNLETIQLRVLERIRECLMDPGYLVIGRTEEVPGKAGFEEISMCIYRKSRKRG